MRRVPIKRSIIFLEPFLYNCKSLGTGVTSTNTNTRLVLVDHQFRLPLLKLHIVALRSADHVICVFLKIEQG